MTITRREVGERHPILAADFGIVLVHLCSKAERRQPLALGIGIQEGFVHALRRSFEDAMEADGARVLHTIEEEDNSGDEVQ